MKFLELHLKGFGKFHDRTISFTDGINVIYGKNEAGKSTMHTFIRGCSSVSSLNVAEHRKMTFTANMNPGKMEEPTRVLSA